MNVFQRSLDALDKLLESTSKEEILRIYKEVSKCEFEGFTVNEFFERKIDGICVNVPDDLFSIADETQFSPPPVKYKYPKNTAPNYSGYFFLCNIAV